MKSSGTWWKILAAGTAITVVLFIAGIALLAVVGESDSQRFDMVGAELETGAAPPLAAPGEGASSNELPWDLDAAVPQPGSAAPDIGYAAPGEPYSTEFGSSAPGDPNYGEYGSADEIGSAEDGEYGSADDEVALDEGEYGSADESAEGESYAYESEDESGEYGSANESYAYESDDESYDESEATQSYGSTDPLYPGAPYSPDENSDENSMDAEEPVAQNAPPIEPEKEDLFDLKSGGGGHSTSAPPADPMAEVDRKLAVLPLGNIAFNTPDTIGLDDTATIELLVSLKEAEEALREAVRGAGQIESARVKLSNRMEARLSGMNFRIEAITPEQQVISSSERTAWRWQIEPTKSDKLELHLTLSALLTIDGEPTARAIRTFERTILVDVPFGHRITTAASDHIELITSAILVPIIGGGYRYYRKRKRRTLPPPSANTPTRRAA